MTLRISTDYSRVERQKFYLDQAEIESAVLALVERSSSWGKIPKGAACEKVTFEHGDDDNERPYVRLIREFIYNEPVKEQ